MTERKTIIRLDANSIDDGPSSLLAFQLGGKIELVTTERHGADTTIVLSVEQASVLAGAIMAALRSMQGAPRPHLLATREVDLEERFEFVMGSDLERDGMFLECQDRVTRRDVLEVFYSDSAQAFTTFTSCGGELPFEVVERFIHTARQRLPPTPGNDDGTTRGTS